MILRVLVVKWLTAQSKNAPYAPLQMNKITLSVEDACLDFSLICSFASPADSPVQLVITAIINYGAS